MPVDAGQLRLTPQKGRDLRRPELIRPETILDQPRKLQVLLPVHCQPCAAAPPRFRCRQPMNMEHLRVLVEIPCDVRSRFRLDDIAVNPFERLHAADVRACPARPKTRLLSQSDVNTGFHRHDCLVRYPRIDERRIPPRLHDDLGTDDAVSMNDAIEHVVLAAPETGDALLPCPIRKDVIVGPGRRGKDDLLNTRATKPDCDVAQQRLAADTRQNLPRQTGRPHPRGDCRADHETILDRYQAMYFSMPRSRVCRGSYPRTRVALSTRIVPPWGFSGSASPCTTSTLNSRETM